VLGLGLGMGLALRLGLGFRLWFGFEFLFCFSQYYFELLPPRNNAVLCEHSGTPKLHVSPSNQSSEVAYVLYVEVRTVTELCIVTY